jgi:hypothetical protein
VRLSDPQRALLGDLATRGCVALGDVLDRQLARRRALVARLERVVARGGADDRDRRAAGQAALFTRLGRLQVLAAAIGVAREADRILTPDQRRGLDRFQPRLRTTPSLRSAAIQLAREAELALALRNDPVDAAVAAALSDTVTEVLLTAGLPGIVAELAGRQAAAAVSLAGLPGTEGIAARPSLPELVRWSALGREAVAGPTVEPRPILSLLAEVLESPLLPAVASSTRFNRRLLELIMTCPGFAAWAAPDVTSQPPDR